MMLSDKGNHLSCDWHMSSPSKKTSLERPGPNCQAHANYGTFISIYVLPVFKSFDPNSHYKVDCAISRLNVVYCICCGQNEDWSPKRLLFFMVSWCGGSESCFARTPFLGKLNKSRTILLLLCSTQQLDSHVDRHFAFRYD